MDEGIKLLVIGFFLFMFVNGLCETVREAERKGRDDEKYKDLRHRLGIYTDEEKKR